MSVYADLSTSQSENVEVLDWWIVWNRPHQSESKLFGVVTSLKYNTSQHAAPQNNSSEMEPNLGSARILRTAFRYSDWYAAIGSRAFAEGKNLFCTTYNVLGLVSDWSQTARTGGKWLLDVRSKSSWFFFPRNGFRLFGLVKESSDWFQTGFQTNCEMYGIALVFFFFFFFGLVLQTGD